MLQNAAKCPRASKPKVSAMSSRPVVTNLLAFSPGVNFEVIFNDDEHLQSSYNLPSTLPGPLCVLAHLIIRTFLAGWYYYWLYLIDEDNEAHRG